MKAAVVLCALVVVVSARPNDKYTTKYDNTDYKEIVENDRLFNAYCDCILEVGRCTPEGKELKSHITDAMETECEKCNEKQKEAVNFVLKYVINNKPEVWKKLCDKYDPTGKYSAKYEKELKSLHSNRR